MIYEGCWDTKWGQTFLVLICPNQTGPSHGYQVLWPMLQVTQFEANVLKRTDRLLCPTTTPQCFVKKLFWVLYSSIEQDVPILSPPAAAKADRDTLLFHPPDLLC